MHEAPPCTTLAVRHASPRPSRYVPCVQLSHGRRTAGANRFDGWLTTGHVNIPATHIDFACYRGISPLNHNGTTAYGLGYFIYRNCCVSISHDTHTHTAISGLCGCVVCTHVSRAPHRRARRHLDRCSRVDSSPARILRISRPPPSPPRAPRPPFSRGEFVFLRGSCAPRALRARYPARTQDSRLCWTKNTSQKRCVHTSDGRHGETSQHTIKQGPEAARGAAGQARALDRARASASDAASIAAALRLLVMSLSSSVLEAQAARRCRARRRGWRIRRR